MSIHTRSIAHSVALVRAMSSSSISGAVYCDDNNDGIRQAGEVGLGGVTVTLTGTNDIGQPVNLSTTTDANGNITPEWQRWFKRLEAIIRGLS